MPNRWFTRTNSPTPCRHSLPRSMACSSGSTRFTRGATAPSSTRGVWVSAHPDVILKMGTKEVLHRTRTMSWGCDTVLYRTAEAMRAELPARLAAGPRVIRRNRGHSGLGVWKVEMLPVPGNRAMVRVLDATKDASEELTLDEFLGRCTDYFED